MSIRKQYSFPSELSLQRPEPTYTTRPLVSPVAPKEEPTYTTRPLQIATKPTSTIIPRPTGTTPYGGGGGAYIPPSATALPPTKEDLSDGGSTEIDSPKKIDWLPIILIGVGAVIFIMKPFK